MFDGYVQDAVQECSTERLVPEGILKQEVVLDRNRAPVNFFSQAITFLSRQARFFRKFIVSQFGEVGKRGAEILEYVCNSFRFLVICKFV